MNHDLQRAFKANTRQLMYGVQRNSLCSTKISCVGLFQKNLTTQLAANASRPGQHHLLRQISSDNSREGLVAPATPQQQIFDIKLLKVL
jgi:hypothetical protein